METALDHIHPGDNPYRSVILDHVLEQGDSKRVMVPMDAGVLVDLLDKGTLQQSQLRRIAYDFAKRERLHNLTDLQRRTGRDYVFAVSSEANLAARLEISDYEEQLEYALHQCRKRRRRDETERDER